jgi:hypothetical protein
LERFISLSPGPDRFVGRRDDSAVNVGIEIVPMPTVLRTQGYRVFFYSNEGDPREPMHIHISKGGAEAKLWLFPRVSVAESHGFPARELHDIMRLVEQHRVLIQRAWHDHFPG